MKKIFLSVILVTVFLSVNLVPSDAQSPEQLYQKGLMKEEGEGNLQEAISLFVLVADNPKADKLIQAKALMHVGMCFEKLGTKEAVKAYQRLIANYPAQKDEVAYARERLTRLTPIAEKVSDIPLTPKFTKIEIPTKPGNGFLSPDGNSLVYVSEKSLWILPVHGKTNPDIAGEPIRLTEPMGVWDVGNMGIVWSSNGKWLAYQATRTGEDKRKIEEIYVISATGGKPVKVNLDLRQNILGYDYRMSLSPDGKILALVFRDNYKKSAIYTISIDGGTQTKLTGPGTREPVFSPDGKLIAYVGIDPQNELGNEIWVIPSAGGNPVLVSNNAGVVKSPVWSPDGSMIAFLARKYKKGWNNASNELWIVPVSKKGGLTDLAAKINLDYSTSSMLSGWSQDNKIGFWFETPYKNVVYTVQATGGQAMQVTPKNSWIPGWSPDGQYLFFEGINTDDWAGIEAIPVDGGDVTKIPVVSEYAVQPGMPTGGISVSPDGKKIVFAGYYYNISDTVAQKKLEGSHIMTIPVSGGKLFQLTANPPMGDGYPTWSPDGKAIAFMRFETINANNTSAISFNIYTIPADGGTPKKITSSSDRVGKGRINWSSDGKWIGFYSDDNAIKVISPEGGNSKIVINDVKPDILDGLSFSPDGNKIAFSNKNKLFTVDLNGENKAEVKTGLDEIHTMPAWSPDGKKIAFSANNIEETDLWLMEKFLPLEKLAQRKEAEAVKEPKEIAIRQVWAGQGVDQLGSASADGKYLTFVDWESGNLAIRNLNTGENKPLTTEGSWKDPRQYAEFSLISPDGNQVAYLWHNEKGTYDIRYLKLGTQTPVILYTCSKNEYIVPELWFSDCKRIIAQMLDSNNKIWKLFLIDVVTGKIQLLEEKKSGSPGLSNLSLSPDEKLIAYDIAGTSDKGMYDINVLSIESKVELPLIKHPANDRLIGWLPGRNELLFTSDRSGTNDVWVVNASNIKSFNMPKRILTNIGEINPLGFKQDGSLYYGVQSHIFESFILPFDQNTGKLSDSLRTIFSAPVFDICWLPDGESLICRQFSKDWNFTLGIYNCKTGVCKTLANNIIANGSQRISPDGKSVLVLGTDIQRSKEKDYDGGIYSIDIKTGKSDEIMRFKQDNVQHSNNIEWDKEGESIFYTSDNHVIKRNIATAGEKILYTDRNLFFMPALRRSFDGNHLLFDGVINSTETIVLNDGKAHLLSISDEGGEARILCDAIFSPAGMYKRTSLSPDGKYIYFSARTPVIKSVLCRIPAEGGTPEIVWQSKDYNIAGISIHPDGEQIALSTSVSQVEIRVIENLGNEVTKVFSENK